MVNGDKGGPLILRASQIHRILTKRPVDISDKIVSARENLENKIAEKELELKQLNFDNLNEYLNTPGLKTVTKTFMDLITKQIEYDADPLPEGAKNYIEEIWLANNKSFFDFSVLEADFGLEKGRLSEQDAIFILKKHYNLPPLEKVVRVTKGNISGICDMKYGKVIRDVKCPKNWRTFRDKDLQATDQSYIWQLITYCYLYDCEEAWLDYVLMPTPSDMIEQETKWFNDYEYKRYLQNLDSILGLPYNQRIKSHDVPIIQEDIDFLLSRVEKAVEYYNALDYEICMNF